MAATLLNPRIGRHRATPDAMSGPERSGGRGRSGPALVVVDVQRGFDDPSWGRRHNPGFEDNLGRLLELWQARGWPLVYVRHDSTTPGSPLRPGTPGNALDEALLCPRPDLVVAKSVNSAFYGTPSLEAWLNDRGIDTVVIAGIQTNHCAETTARMAGNLGYRMLLAIDATYTFDRAAVDGGTISAEDLVRVTAANLDGEFGAVVTTEQLVAGARDG
jgi:nicotinamidase-related amidase